jgi:hypothetical protein
MKSFQSTNMISRFHMSGVVTQQLFEHCKPQHSNITESVQCLSRESDDMQIVNTTIKYLFAGKAKSRRLSEMSLPTHKQQHHCGTMYVLLSHYLLTTILSRMPATSRGCSLTLPVQTALEAAGTSRTSRPSRYYSYFIFWRFHLQISALRQTILTFPDFPQNLQVKRGLYLKLDHDRFMPRPFQFIILWSFYQPELLTASLNKPRINTFRNFVFQVDLVGVLGTRSSRPCLSACQHTTTTPGHITVRLKFQCTPKSTSSQSC